MSLLDNIKNARSLTGVSQILGFSPNKLSYILFKIPPKEKYCSFKIKKKNGELREISAPEPRLKNLQRRLANLLNTCSSEIDKIDKMAGRKPLSHGFKNKLSIYTNAQIHKNRRYVLNFDLKDFFPTINFGRVRGYFIKNKHFELHKNVATVIAQIACHDNQLPQGSPCSPIISNLIGHLLDVRLVQLAKKNGCSYSRYADDITFSTNQKEFPNEVAYQDKGNLGAWHLSEILERQVLRSGFIINSNKTNMRCRHNRQLVTGLIVNEKVNIRSEYYKLARAMTHSLFKTGKYKIPAKLSPMDIQDKGYKTISETSLARLEGILNHIYYIKNRTDKREWRDKQGNPTAIKNLFKKFLFFKHFGFSDKPVIFCEGSSDIIYIKLALKKHIGSFPSLIEIDEGKLNYKVSFLRYSQNVKNVMQLNGGTAQMAKFVGNYDGSVKTYTAWSSSQPVILLTDNDKGATGVFKAIEKHSKSRPTLKSVKNFYPINNNLYLIKIPNLGANKETVIEDLFDLKWRKKVINGKKFSLDNEADHNKYYGKMMFAEEVISKNFDKVNFDRFKILLKRIADTISFHIK